MYRYLQQLVLLILTVLSSACAMAPPGMPLVAPNERIDMRDVSFLPPERHSWYVVTHEPLGIELGAMGEEQDETLAVQASYFEIPVIQNAEDLIAHLRPQVAPEASERFTPLEFTMVPANFHGLACANAFFKIEDRQAQKRTSRADPMHLRIATLYCLHPWEKNVALHLSYSNRHYPDEGDPDFRDDARAMFDTLRAEPGL
ncbi:MAG TPA: hypothetical protein VF275_00680 [Gammaproteobacteria bacterium]